MSDTVSVAARLDAASFPHPVPKLQLRETSISWVLLTGPYAYKIKKPVHLEFIDASTLGRRHFLCEEELRLNRRFAPELYLDVLPIVMQDGHLRIGAPGVPLEYTVRMRQFDSAEELTEQLAHNTVGAAELAALGACVAEWHQAAPSAPPQDTYGSPALVRNQVLENFEPLRGCVYGEEAECLQRLQHWAATQLARLEALLEQRRHLGRVRECHGDLHAGNIVRWRGHWLAFDCLEFEPRLRWIDVISDVAFLFMDLSARGKEPLAYTFLSAYLETCGDYDGLRLLSLFGVYRALVRAKVDAFALAAQSGDRPALHAQADELRERLRGRLRIAERLAAKHRAALLLMHGVTGSGKSWLSGQLIGALGAVRARSDVERRRRFGAGSHSEAASAATYERLRSCAESALDSGYRLIVDAAFLDGAQRRAFEQLALRRGCPLIIVSCTAPPATLAARLERRARASDDPSEATREVLDAQLQTLQPIDEAERPWLIEVDTAGAQVLARALGAIQSRLQSA